MATYKLIQDIEAEDHILGPLTLRQFIFALITAFLVYVNVICVAKHVSFLLILFLPPTLLTAFFAFPFGRDQPTEVWALAKLRFWFKPRQRMWNQSGVKELVTITVPKKVERVYTDGLSKGEVQSRLKALANTIDSRGWAVKNVNVNSFSYDPMAGTASDRLVDPAAVPQAVPDETITASDDILDERNNPIAQQFDTMMNQAAEAHRQAVIDQLNDRAPAQPTPGPGAPADYWFLGRTDPGADLPADQMTFDNRQVVQPGSQDDAALPASPVASEPVDPATESAIAAQLKAHKQPQTTSYNHLRTLKPLGSQPVSPPATAPAPTSAVAPDPAILSLATNNDLNVATLAREAHKAKDGTNGDNPPTDEVVIPLR